MRAAGVLGVVSVVSALLALSNWRTAVIAVVLGALALLAVRLRSERFVAAVGAAFLLAALAQLVDKSWLGATGSTASLWIGLGAGLLALGLYGGAGPPDRDDLAA